MELPFLLSHQQVIRKDFHINDSDVIVQRKDRAGRLIALPHFPDADAPPCTLGEEVLALPLSSVFHHLYLTDEVYAVRVKPQLDVKIGQIVHVHEVYHSFIGPDQTVGVKLFLVGRGGLVFP